MTRQSGTGSSAGALSTPRALNPPVHPMARLWPRADALPAGPSTRRAIVASGPRLPPCSAQGPAGNEEKPRDPSFSLLWHGHGAAMEAGGGSWKTAPPGRAQGCIGHTGDPTGCGEPSVALGAGVPLRTLSPGIAGTCAMARVAGVRRPPAVTPAPLGGFGAATNGPLLCPPALPSSPPCIRGGFCPMPPAPGRYCTRSNPWWAPAVPQSGNVRLWRPGGAEVKAARVPPPPPSWEAPCGDARRTVNEGCLPSDRSTPQGLDVLSLHGTGELASAWLSIPSHVLATEQCRTGQYRAGGAGGACWCGCPCHMDPREEVG